MFNIYMNIIWSKSHGIILFNFLMQNKDTNKKDLFKISKKPFRII